MSRSTSTVTRWAATATAAALVCTGVAVATPVYAAGGTTVVTSLADTLDPGTLRSALEDAESAGGTATITFSVTGTIQLDSPLPTITTEGITIEGPGADALVIQAQTGEDMQPAFTYRPETNGTARISGLTFAGGASVEASVSHGTSARIAPLAADDEPSPIYGTLTFSLIGQPKASLDPNAWAIFESTIFEKDAQLGALANNGGNTLTHLPAATSPVIRAGNVETLVGAEYDQRNAPRVVDGRVDIGSVQVQPAAPTPVVPAEAAQLAKTGTGVELPLLAIAGMLLAGVALLAARRRRA